MDPAVPSVLALSGGGATLAVGLAVFFLYDL